MSVFDFRNLLGRVPGAVDPDPKLADGVEKDEHLAGLHWSLMSRREGVPHLVEHLTQHILMNANINGLCAQGLIALVVARLGQCALRDLAEGIGAQQRQHLIGELQGVLDAMRSGDA